MPIGLLVKFINEGHWSFLACAIFWAILFGFKIHNLRANSRQPFTILTHTASYGQKDEILGLVVFPDVREVTESASSLNIRHNTLSWRAKTNPTLRRHDFQADAWEQLVGTLLDRIRTQSPEARIRTALNPEG